MAMASLALASRTDCGAVTSSSKMDAPASLRCWILDRLRAVAMTRSPRARICLTKSSPKPEEVPVMNQVSGLDMFGLDLGGLYGTSKRLGDLRRFNEKLRENQSDAYSKELFSNNNGILYIFILRKIFSNNMGGNTCSPLFLTPRDCISKGSKQNFTFLAETC